MLDSALIVHHAGPIVVTLAYIGLYYVFMLNIMFTKIRLSRTYKERGEKFDRYFGEDREMLAADRLQLNLLEHMPPFLVLLWLTAWVVGPWWATGGGIAYLAVRIAYPFLLGKRVGRQVGGTILLSTIPGYGVLAYFLVAVAVGLIGHLLG